MACKTALINVIIIICLLSKGVPSKLDKINFFLTNYEVTKIIEVPQRTKIIKTVDQAMTERSWKVKAFGKEFTIDLTNYYPKEDAELYFISKVKNTTSSFLDQNYVLHYGSVRELKDSFVLGYFTYDDHFSGYIIADEVYCIEPLESKGSVIVYRFKDVIMPGCAQLHGENLDCTESKYFESWKPNPPPPKPKHSKYNLFYNKYLDLYDKMVSQQKQTKTHSNIIGTEETAEKDARKERDGAHKASYHEDKSKHDTNEKNAESLQKEKKNKNEGSKSEVDAVKKKESEQQKKSMKVEDDDWEDSMSEEERRDWNRRYKKKQTSDKGKKDKVREKVNDDDERKNHEGDENDDEDEEKEKETKIDSSKRKEIQSHEEDGYSASNRDNYWMDLLCSNEMKHSDTKHKENHHSEKTKKEKEHEKNDEENETHASNRTENLSLKQGTYSVDGLNRGWLQLICANRAKNSERKNGKKQDFDKKKIYEDPENNDEEDESETNALRKAGNPSRQKDSYNVDDWDRKWMDTVSTKGTKHTDRRKEKKHNSDNKRKNNGQKKNGSHTKDSGKEDENDSDDDDDDNDFINLKEYVGSVEKKLDLQTFLKNGTDLPDIALDSIVKNSSVVKSNESSNISSFDFNENKEYEQKTQNEEELNLNIEALQEEKGELQCDVEIVLSTSFREKFGNSDKDMIQDIFTQITLLNKIFRKVDLQRKAMPFHLTISVASIIIYGDEVYNPFTSDANLEYFTTKYHLTNNRCLCIGFVNHFPQSGQFFDGYIPSGGGGACANYGNTFLVSHGTANSPTPMALFFASFVRGITRALGANDVIDECHEGSYPNPMMVLQDYLLTKEITPKKEFSIFTHCNIEEMSVVFNSRECWKKLDDPLCGNGIIDEGEECDCGPRYSCTAIDPCCTPPHNSGDRITSKTHVKGCQLIKGAECGRGPPCCFGCKITKEKIVCYNGPGSCDIAECDGESADCPTGIAASNGMICSAYNISMPEPLICKDQKCEEGLCETFKLKPCTCAMGTDRDCDYCCIQDGKCKAAGKDLQLVTNRHFHKPDGTECIGGLCERGLCVRDLAHLMVNRSEVQKPPRDTVRSGCGRITLCLAAILTGMIFCFTLNVHH